MNSSRAWKEQQRITQLTVCADLSDTRFRYDEEEWADEANVQSDTDSNYLTSTRIEDRQDGIDGSAENGTQVKVERTAESNGDAHWAGGRVLQLAKDLERERERESKT